MGAAFLATLPLNLVPYAGPALSKWAMSGVMGSESTVSTMLDAKARGLSDVEAFRTGIVAGINETLGERASIEHLLPKAKVGSAKQMVKHLINSFAAEGSEEIVTDLLNEGYDRTFNGENSAFNQSVENYMKQGYSRKEAKSKTDKDFLNQMIQDGTVGGLAGLMFGGASGITGYVQNNSTERSIKENGKNIIENGETENLIEKALELKEDSQAYKTAYKLNGKKNVTEEEIGMLQKEVLQEVSNQAGENYGDIVEEAKTVLKEREVDDTDAEEAAEAVAKVMTASEVTPKEVAIIEENPQVQETLEEMRDVFRENTYVINNMSEISKMSAKKENVSDENLPDANENIASEEMPKNEGTEWKSKSIIPDAVKMSEDEIAESVKTEQYHPRYDLGSSVTTDYGNGTVQEIIASGSDSRKVLVNYEDGTSDVVTMDLDNDIVDDTAEAALYAYANDMGYHGANSLIAYASDEVLDNPSSIRAYVKGAKEMYRAGRTRSSDFESAYQGSILSLTMPENLANRFYKAGVSDRKDAEALHFAKNMKYRQQRKSIKQPTKKKAAEQRQEQKKAERTIKKYKEINLKSVSERLSDRQKNELQAAKKIGAAMKINVKFFESNGEKYSILSGANGFFDPKNNEIWIDIQAGRHFKDVGETAILKTMSHELTHYIAAQSNSKYALLENYVLKLLEKETGRTREKLITDKMQQFDITEKIAREEITADACEMMLKDSKAVEQLAMENKSLFEDIKQWIHEFLESVKKAFAGLHATSKEAKALEAYTSEIQEIWDNALVEAARSDANRENGNINRDINYFLRNLDEVHDEKIEENRQIVSEMEPVAVINEDILDSFEGNAKQKVTQFFNSIGNKMNSELYGEVECGRRTVKSIFAHKLTRIKMYSIAAIPEVISKGKAIQYIENRKDRGRDNIVIAAPVILNNVEEKGRYLIGASIGVSETNNFLELYEVFCVKEKEGQYDTSSTTSFDNKISSRGASDYPSIITLLREVADVNKGNSENDNSKFSMRLPVEESKDLIAVHNVTEQKFIENLKLGGFPMPSIAITKAKQGHVDFGDISVVFTKDTISPEASKNNKVYSGDAWTPLFPNIEWKLNEKGLKKLADTFNTTPNYIEQYLTDPESAVGKLENDITVREAFLKQSGVNIEQKTKMPPYVTSLFINKGSRKMIEDRNLTIEDIITNKKIREELSMAAYPEKENELNFRKRIREKFAASLENVSDRTREELENDYKAYKGTAEPVVDTNAYEADLENYINAHQEEFTDYIERALDNVYEDKYIVRENVDKFDANGNRKSFDQLHMPYNLKNLVAAMKKQEKGKGGGWFGGAKNLKGAGTREFTSIEDIRKNKNSIQDIPEEKLDTLYKRLNQKIIEIDHEIIGDKASDDLAFHKMINDVNEIMVESFALDDFSKAAVQKKFSEWYQITDKAYSMMKSLKEELENIPVKYFEAKPERAVSLDEIAYVVIPRESTENLKNLLNEKGIEYKEYESGNKKSRIAAVNSDPDIRFSMRNISEEDYGTLLEERDDLKNQVDLLRKQFEVTKGHAPDISDVRKIGQKILKEYDSKYSMDDFLHNMKEVINFTKKSKGQNYNAVMNAMMKMGRKIAEQSEFKETSLYDQYAGLRKGLRTTRITLNENQKAAAAEIYGTYNEFRKRQMGRLRLANDGISLDEMWQQYAEMYPELFSKETNDADQIRELIDIIDMIKSPKIERMSGMEIDYAARDIAQDIFREYFSLPSVQTFADARIHELQEARQEYAENLKNARKEYRQQYEKKEYRDKIVRLRNNLAAKVTKKKSVPFGITDKLIDVLNEIYRGNMNLGSVERSTQTELVGLGIPQDVAKKITDKCTLVFLENNHESVGRSEMRLEKWLAEGNLNLNKVEMRHIMNTVHDHYFSVAAVNKTEKALHSRLKSLQETYAKFKDKSAVNYEWRSEYNERLDQRLKEITEIVEDKALTSLDRWQMESLYNSLKEVSHIVTEATRQLSETNNQTNQEVAQKIIQEVSGTKKKRNIAQKAAHMANVYIAKGVLNDVRYIRMLTNYDKNSQLGKLYNEVFKASRSEDMFRMNATKPFDALTENTKEYNRFIGKGGKNLIEDAIYDTNGNAVAISHSQLVQIIMSWERPQGRRHMEQNGLTIYDVKALLKGNLNDARDNSKRTFSVTDTGIEKLKTYLTDFDKEWIKCSRYLFNQQSQEAINNVSMILNGVPLATAKNYIRLYVDDNFVETESSAVKFDETLQGNGSLKATAYNAPQPLRIIGIENVVNDNIDFVSRYQAYAVPIRNLRKALNYTMPGGKQSVAQSVQDAYGSDTYKNLVRIVDEMETRRAVVKKSSEYDRFQKAWGKVHSNFVAATLNTNISVSIKQFASYPTAMAYINSRNLGKAMLSRVNLDEIDAHTGAHYKRRLGLSHMELEVIRKESKIQDIFEHLPGLLNGRKWITTVDCFTTAKLWNAAKFQINSEIKKTGIQKGSEEYWNRVTDLYNTVLENTQPMYDVQYRTAMQKSNNAFAEIISMFQTQLLQTFGMVYDAVGECRAAATSYKENKTSGSKKTLRDSRKRLITSAVPALVNSAVLFTFLTLAVGFALNKTKQWRDEETGEIDIGAHLPEGIVKNLIGMMIPYVGDELFDLTNACLTNGKHYDFESPSLALLNNALSEVVKEIQYIKAIGTGEKEFNLDEFMPDLEDMIYNISSLCGIETENIANIVKAGVYYTGKAFGNKQIENALGYQYESSQLYEDYYEAIVAGNQEDMERYKKMLKDAGKSYSAIDSNIAKKLREKDSRVHDAAAAYLGGDYTKYSSIVEEIHADGFKNDVVLSAVKSEVRAMEPQEEEEDTDTDGTKNLYSAADLYKAIRNGNHDSYDAAMDYLTKEKDRSDIESSVQTQIKNAYEDGEITLNQAQVDMEEFLGMTELERYETVSKWQEKHIYSDLADDIRAGDKESSQAMMELLYAGGEGKR